MLAEATSPLLAPVVQMLSLVSEEDQASWTAALLALGTVTEMRI